MYGNSFGKYAAINNPIKDLQIFWHSFTDADLFRLSLPWQPSPSVEEKGNIILLKDKDIKVMLWKKERK